MNTIIMWIMAIGAVIGGIDKILKNKFGLGQCFENGFMLLGPTAISMVGIICLIPLISAGMEVAVVPLWDKLGLDPGILGGIIALDMGGYQLSMELANLEAFGRYAGIVVGATFGCTISFTIPVGMGMIDKQTRPLFAKGMLVGLGMMPVTLLVGGLFCGLDLITVLIHSLPIFILSVLLMIGIGKFPDRTIKGFTYFAAFIGLLTTVGLIGGAFAYMTGVELIPGLAPIEEAMEVVASIGVVLLGSLTIAELLKRALTKPLAWIGKKTGMNGDSVAGLLVGIVSPVPAINMMKSMDDRGKVVNAAFLVCGASAIAAHIGFTFGVEPDLVMPLFAAKMCGAGAGVLAALMLTKGVKSCEVKSRDK